MDVNLATREILHTVRRIDRNTHTIRMQTEPKMPQLWAAAFGLLTCAMGTFVLEKGDVPYLSPMYEQASDYVANNAATAGIWFGDMIGNVDRSMPDLPANTTTYSQIRGLDAMQSCRLMMTIRQHESSHNYQQPGNWAGYIGAYQFGATALASVGLVSHESVKNAPKRVRQGLPPQQIIFLKNPANWLGGWSYQKYLNSKEAQDRAFLSLANMNVSAGFRARALSKTQPERIAGYVAAAHLKGSGAANSWYLRGKDSKDGNGNRTSNYARIGEAAISKRNQYCGEKSEILSGWKLWN